VVYNDNNQFDYHSFSAKVSGRSGTGGVRTVTAVPHEAKGFVIHNRDIHAFLKKNLIRGHADTFYSERMGHYALLVSMAVNKW